MVNYYTELNLDRNLKGDQLKTALQAVQKKWIGRQTAADLNRRQEAERKLTYTQDAMKVLTDELTRKKYDEEIESSSYDRTNNTEEYAARTDEYQDVNKAIKETWRLIHKGNYTEAIIVGRKATQINGSSAEAWVALANADAQWGNIEDAIYEYKKAISLEPGNPTFYVELAEVLLENNMLSDAKVYADKAVYLDPGSVSSKILESNICFSSGKIQDGIEIVQGLLKNDPEKMSYKQMIAGGYYQLGMQHAFYNKNDGYYHCVDESDINKMIEYMTLAESYYPAEEYKSKIQWGTDALQKKFDIENWKSFILPAFFMLGGSVGFMIGLLSIILLVFVNYKPKWRLNRKSLFDEKTIGDYISKFFGLVVMALSAMIVFIWTIALASISGRND